MANAPLRLSEDVTKDTFVFSFEGGNEINAAVLGLTISNISFIVHEIAKENNVADCLIFNVAAFNPGSFRTIFSVILNKVAQIDLTGTIEKAANFFTILSGVFQIKQHLKGEKPISVRDNLREGTVHIRCPDGTNVVAPRGSKIVITNPAVDKKCSEIALATKTCNPDMSILLENKQEKISFPPDAVANIAVDFHKAENAPQNCENTQRIVLPIKSVTLIGNGAWKFTYGSRSISAKINDASFLSNVHNGETSYSAGDKLEVLLKTETHLSPLGEVTRETYTIEKVFSHLPSTFQSSEQLRF